MKALIVVDMQNDFMPKGPLGVAGAQTLVPVINRVLTKFSVAIASLDWHPSDHVSFAINHPGKKVGDSIEVEGEPQTLWPVHCVQNTPGAELVSTLNKDAFRAFFQKGVDPKIDSYSIFFDNAHLRQTGLESFLKGHGITEVYLAGIATDYCVLYSALDAIELGFTTYVITDACAGINLKEGDVDKSLKAIAASGGRIITSDELFRKAL